MPAATRRRLPPAGSPTSVVLVEMTSGAGLAAGGLLLVAALVGGLAMVPPNTGPSWSTPFNLALTGLLFVAPLGAGAVTWLMQDHRARGFGELGASSDRGRILSGLPRVAAVLIWSVLAYGVLLGLFVLRTAHRGAPDAAPLLLTLLAGAFLVTSAALGWTVGALCAPRVAGPLLAVALFGLVFVGSDGDGRARALSPVDTESRYRTFLQPHVALVWVQVTLLVAVTVLALTLLAGRHRRAGGLTGAVLLAGALVGLVRTDPDPTEIRGAPKVPACTSGGAVTLCLRPENADLLPASAHALAAAAVALEPYVSVPARFAEPGIDARAEIGPGVFVPPAGPGDPLAFQAAALDALLPLPCRHRPGDARAGIAYGDLLTWAQARVAGPAGVPAYALDRIRPVLVEDPDHQRRWVRFHLTASCA